MAQLLKVDYSGGVLQGNGGWNASQVGATNGGLGGVIISTNEGPGGGIYGAKFTADRLTGGDSNISGDGGALNESVVRKVEFYSDITREPGITAYDLTNELGPSGKNIIRNVCNDSSTGGAGSGSPSERSDGQLGRVPYNSRRRFVWYQRYVSLASNRTDNWAFMGPIEIHDEGNIEQPPFGLCVSTNGRLVLDNPGMSTTGNSHNYFYGNPNIFIDLGKWYLFEFSLRYSMDSSAYWRMWVDGVLWASRDGRNVASTSDGYWKYANYRNANQSGDSIWDMSDGYITEPTSDANGKIGITSSGSIDINNIAVLEGFDKRTLASLGVSGHPGRPKDGDTWWHSFSFKINGQDWATTTKDQEILRFTPIEPNGVGTVPAWSQISNDALSFVIDDPSVTDFTRSTSPKLFISLPKSGVAPVTSTNSSTTNNVITETVLTGQDTIWAMEWGPNNRLFFTERPGRIKQWNPDTGEIKTLHTISTEFINAEEGLQGMALDPQFSQNGYIYVYYTYGSDVTTAKNRLSRFTYNLTSETISGASETILVNALDGYQYHNGGRVKFGPDGKLYFSVGDGADNGSSLAERAQDTSDPNGKIHRINKDGTIPSDNPIPGNSIWSYGHRNPQGLAWHPTTGDLWSTEHGPTASGEPRARDEVNLITKGGNYGWPKYYGTLSNPLFPDMTVTDAIGPKWNSGTSVWAPCGCTFYSGNALGSAWKNALLFTGLGIQGRANQGRALYRLRLSSDGKTGTQLDTLFQDQFGRLRDIIQGPDGYLYMSTSNKDGRGDGSADKIIRIKPETTTTSTTTYPNYNDANNFEKVQVGASKIIPGLWYDVKMQSEWKKTATGTIKVWLKERNTPSFTTNPTLTLTNRSTIFTLSGTAGENYLRAGLYANFETQDLSNSISHALILGGNTEADVTVLPGTTPSNATLVKSLKRRTDWTTYVDPGNRITEVTNFLPPNAAAQNIVNSIKYDLRDGDRGGNDPTTWERIETEWGAILYDTDYWLSWWEYFDPSWPYSTQDRWQVIGYIHKVNSVEPPIMMEVNGDNRRLNVTAGANSHSYKFNTPLDRGKWNHYRLGFHLSTDPTKGWVQVFKGTAEVYPKTYLKTTSDTVSTTLGWGAFRAAELNGSAVHYISGMGLYTTDPGFPGDGTVPPTGGGNETPNIDPFASFNYAPLSPKVGESITLNSTSYDSDGSIVKYEWDINGDGGFITGSANLVTGYASAGNYNVVHRVTDNRGGTDAATATITVVASSGTSTPGTGTTGGTVKPGAAPSGRPFLYAIGGHSATLLQNTSFNAYAVPGALIVVDMEYVHKDPNKLKEWRNKGAEVLLYTIYNECRVGGRTDWLLRKKLWCGVDKTGGYTGYGLVPSSWLRDPLLVGWVPDTYLMNFESSTYLQNITDFFEYMMNTYWDDGLFDGFWLDNQSSRAWQGGWDSLSNAEQVAWSHASYDIANNIRGAVGTTCILIGNGVQGPTGTNAPWSGWPGVGHAALNGMCAEGHTYSSYASTFNSQTNGTYQTKKRHTVVSSQTGDIALWNNDDRWQSEVWVTSQIDDVYSPPYPAPSDSSYTFAWYAADLHVGGLGGGGGTTTPQKNFIFIEQSAGTGERFSQLFSVNGGVAPGTGNPGGGGTEQVSLQALGHAPANVPLGPTYIAPGSADNYLRTGSDAKTVSWGPLQLPVISSNVVTDANFTNPQDGMAAATYSGGTAKIWFRINSTWYSITGT